MQKHLCAVQYFGFLQNFVVRWTIRIGFQVNCQQIQGLSAVFVEGLPASDGLVRRFYGGVAGWPAGHLMTASFTGGRIHGLRMTPIHKLL